MLTQEAETCLSTSIDGVRAPVESFVSVGNETCEEAFGLYEEEE